MKFLLSHEEAKLVYTVKFNQDTAEAFLDSKELEDNKMIILWLDSFWKMHKFWWCKNHWQLVKQ